MKMSKALPLLLAAVAYASAGAADLDYSMKVRGIAGTATKDGVRNGLAFGFNVGILLNKSSRVNVEVGYRYLTGDGRNVAFPANSIGSVLADPSMAVTGTPQPGASTNFQKTNVQGFTLRGTYGQAFLTDHLFWHAGVSVNFMKSRMDAIGDFRDSSNAAAGSWAFNPEKTATTASPLVGVSYDFSESGGLEFNVILDSYKQVTLDPAFNAAATPANTRVTPTVGSKNVNTLKIEVGYTFRF